MSTTTRVEAEIEPGHGSQPRSVPPTRTLALVSAAAVPTVVYFFVILRNMTYAWDDFIQFGVTTRFGIGRELLTYNLFEHFGPVNRLVHGVLVSWGGLDVRWGILFAVAVFYAFSLALVDLARVLGASWGRTWLALAICTVTPSTVLVGAFLDPFTHVLIPVAASAVAMSACVRWTRSRQLRHALVATLAVTTACLTQERGIFIVVLLLGTRLLVAERRLPVRSWFRTALSDWSFFVGPVVAACSTAWIVATFYATDAPRGGVTETAEFVARAWTTQFVPMLTGTYSLEAGWIRTAAVVVVNLLVLLLAVWTIRVDPANLRPWLLLLGWFGLHMAFVGFGRLGLGSIDTFLADPNFYSYQLPAVVAVMASVRVDRKVSSAHPGSGYRPARRVLLAAGVVVIAALVVGSTLPVARRPEQLAPDYLATSVQEIRAADADGSAAIAPTRVPDDLVPPGYAPYNSGEFFLQQADPDTSVDLDPSNPLFLDRSGRLTAGTATPLAVVPAASLGEGLQVADGAGTLDADGYCVSSPGGGHVSLPLPEAVTSPGGALWLRLVTSGGAPSLRPASWSGAAWTDGPPSAVRAGSESHSYVLDAQRVEQVDLLDLSAERLCIQQVQIYAMGAEGPAGCGWVQADGSISRAEEGRSTPTCTP